MPACRLRPASLADLPALAALEALFPVDRMSRRSLRWALTHAHACCLVAPGHAGLDGYGLNFYRRGSRQAHLYSIIVAPGQRRLGVAAQLLTALEADARRHGCHGMRLEVQTGNAAAIRFYEKHGYHACGLKPAYYDNGSDALKMEKPLEPRPRTGSPR